MEKSIFTAEDLEQMYKAEIELSKYNEMTEKEREIYDKKVSEKLGSLHLDGLDD